MSGTSIESETKSTCANCGKGEEASIKLKACTACKSVKYCNRDCQIAHRPQHKKECKRRAKELHDEKLFKQPPPLEDCPICFVRLPSLDLGSVYMACCGKMLCRGCVHAFQWRAIKARRIKEDDLCPFCRTPPPSSDGEMIKRYEKRIDLNDAEAIHIVACHYCNGSRGLPRNHAKALELYHRAAELGYAEAYANIGSAYELGDGVEVDEKKGIHYWELAAMGGNVEARHNLGCLEGNLGNMDRALKHWMIAVKDGCADSLEKIKLLYSKGYTTKEVYEKALCCYQLYVDEIKTDQRDEAAAFNDANKYY